MNKNLILTTALILSTLLIHCQKKPVSKNIIPFATDLTISDYHGTSKDSLTLYFPRKIFIDSIKVEDTFFFLKRWSFALFKMNEPILYNFHLKREIYRLIIARSFHKFFIIHIEKNRDSTFVMAKGLNRQVEFPFTRMGRTILYVAPGKNKPSQIELDKYKLIDDSLDRKYNNTNYYIDQYLCKKLSLRQWQEFVQKIDSVKFWNSPPKICDEFTQVDGSIWILEGHNKDGYQFHEELSPFGFYRQPEYARLFRYIVELSGLGTDQFYYY